MHLLIAYRLCSRIAYARTANYVKTNHMKLIKQNETFFKA